MPGAQELPPVAFTSSTASPPRPSRTNLPAFSDLRVRQQALTHRSVSSTQNYELFEAFGDRLVNAVAAEIAIRAQASWRPQSGNAPLSEAHLSRFCELLSGNKHLAEVTVRCGLDKEVRTYRATSEKVLADVFEAFVGAYALDAGREKAMDWAFSVLQADAYDFFERLAPDPTAGRLSRRKRKQAALDAASDEALGPPRSVPPGPSGAKHTLATLAQRFQLFLQYPVDEQPLGRRSGLWRVSVKIGPRVLGSGEGRSRSQASQEAAAAALRVWRDPISPEEAGPQAPSTKRPRIEDRASTSEDGICPYCSGPRPPRDGPTSPPRPQNPASPTRRPHHARSPPPDIRSATSS